MFWYSMKMLDKCISEAISAYGFQFHCFNFATGIGILTNDDGAIKLLWKLVVHNVVVCAPKIWKCYFGTFAHLYPPSISVLHSERSVCSYLLCFLRRRL